MLCGGSLKYPFCFLLMMIRAQRSAERGKADYHWLSTRYSFSFADYYNPESMGFGKLRVLNDDVIDSGSGFPMHHHDNMEIVTIVLKGSLEHEDSMGNKGVIKAGEVQRMSAGSGVMHSEYNASASEKVELLQVWVETQKLNLKPSYEQRKVDLVEDRFVEVVGSAKGALKINQDCKFYLGKFRKGLPLKQKIPKGKGLYVFVIEGSLKMKDIVLEKRDAAGVSDEKEVEMTSLMNSYALGIEVSF